MIKAMQILINSECDGEFRLLIDKLDTLDEGIISEKRLRTCNARVIETKSYYILISYRTLVAFIDKSSMACYDVLRKVYGYTSTSAQHIAKFRHDYSPILEKRWMPL